MNNRKWRKSRDNAANEPEVLLSVDISQCVILTLILVYGACKVLHVEGY